MASSALRPKERAAETGALIKGKIGAAYLATRADVPLVPVALTGTEVGLPAVFRLSRPRITVTIGPPFRLPDSSPQAEPDSNWKRTLTLIMRTLAGMLPEKYRGVYSRWKIAQ